MYFSLFRNLKSDSSEAKCLSPILSFFIIWGRSWVAYCSNPLLAGPGVGSVCIPELKATAPIGYPSIAVAIAPSLFLCKANYPLSS